MKKSKKTRRAKQIFSLKNFIIMFVAIGTLVALSFWAGTMSKGIFVRCDYNNNGRQDGGDMTYFMSSYRLYNDLNRDGQVNLKDWDLKCNTHRNLSTPTPVWRLSPTSAWKPTPASAWRPSPTSAYNPTPAPTKSASSGSCIPNLSQSNTACTSSSQCCNFNLCTNLPAEPPAGCRDNTYKCRVPGCAPAGTWACMMTQGCCAGLVADGFGFCRNP